MNNFLFLDTDNNELNLKLIASFFCSQTKKSYVIIDNQEKIFSSNSSYNNLDVLEIASFSGKDIKLKEIQDDEWEIVKNFIYENIFGKIKGA